MHILALPNIMARDTQRLLRLEHHNSDKAVVILLISLNLHHVIFFEEDLSRNFHYMVQLMSSRDVQETLSYRIIILQTIFATKEYSIPIITTNVVNRI